VQVGAAHRCSTVSLHQSPLRPRFLSLSRRLESSRRSTAPRPGRVGRRVGAGGRAASSRVTASRSQHCRRFCHWLRLPWLVTRTSSPRAARSRLTADGRPTTSSVSTVKVAFDEAVLTCWPPAPPERANVQFIAVTGTTRPPGVRRSSVESMFVGRTAVVRAARQSRRTT
jgi:hypothetical protein